MVVLILAQRLGHIVRPDKQHHSQPLGFKMSDIISRICWVCDLVMFKIATSTELKLSASLLYISMLCSVRFCCPFVVEICLWSISSWS